MESLERQQMLEIIKEKNEEIESLSHRLKKEQSNHNKTMLTADAALNERDECKRRCQSVLHIWKDHYPLTELWKRHGDAAEWFEEKDEPSKIPTGGE